jgi:hypothetical protein
VRLETLFEGCFLPVSGPNQELANGSAGLSELRPDVPNPQNLVNSVGDSQVCSVRLGEDQTGVGQAAVPRDGRDPSKWTVRRGDRHSLERFNSNAVADRVTY